MNKNYRYILLLKLYKLRSLYEKQNLNISRKKEEKLYEIHVPKVTEFYERNKSKELLDFLLKNRHYSDINLLLTQAEHIARQDSAKRRKILVNACLKGLGSDYSALYVVSNQITAKDMKRMIDIYFGNDYMKSELIREARENILIRTREHNKLKF